MPRLNPDDLKSPASGMHVPVDIEAVYKPILESLPARAQNLEGFRVLHIASCRMSAEEHYEGIDEMAKRAGVRVVRLYDGVSCADKARSMKTPTGILLTTPEALEAFVVIRAPQLLSLFGHLEYLVVEESDAGMQSKRARKLQSTLSRINPTSATLPRRIVLSTDARGAAKAQ